MNCPNCNNKVVSKVKFCAGCGYDISSLDENSGLEKIKNKMPFKIILTSLVVVGILFLGINKFSQSNELYPFENSDEYVGYMNAKGEIVIEAQFDSGSYFNEGMALVKDDGDYYFINTKGEIVIESDILDELEVSISNRFENGLFPVILDDKSGYINKKGVP